jgi:hypothetical protein
LAETITDIQYDYQKTGKGLLFSSTSIWWQHLRSGYL